MECLVKKKEENLRAKMRKIRIELSEQKSLVDKVKNLWEGLASRVIVSESFKMKSSKNYSRRTLR